MLRHYGYLTMEERVERLEKIIKNLQFVSGVTPEDGMHHKFLTEQRELTFELKLENSEPDERVLIETIFTIGTKEE